METSTHQDPALEVSTSVVACRFEGLESRMKTPGLGRDFFNICQFRYEMISIYIDIYIYINICIYLYIYGYMDVYILIHIKPLQGLWLWCFISGGPAVGFGNHLY